MSKELYGWIKQNDETFYVVFKDGKKRPIIATCKDAEKAQFLATAANQFRLSPVSTDWGKLEKDFYEWIRNSDPSWKYAFEWFKDNLVSSDNNNGIVPCVAQVDSSNSIEQLKESVSALEKIIALGGDWNEAKQLARKCLAGIKYPNQSNNIHTTSPCTVGNNIEQEVYVVHKYLGKELPELVWDKVAAGNWIKLKKVRLSSLLTDNEK